MTIAAPQASVDLRFGDCLAVLRTLDDESVSAILTDPPYGLSDHKPAVVTAALTAWISGDREHVPNGRGFMGREWDGFVPPPAVWDECLRVLRPGGHLLVFAAPRTMDLMGLSVRLAGFEIRDSIGAALMAWTYGSGMPKGQNVGKAIDRMAGAEREVIGTAADFARDGASRRTDGSHVLAGANVGNDPIDDRWSAPVTAPATPEAARWEGWNTSLKPSWEPIIVARKPFPGTTVAVNVMEHGTGALNVDACRAALAASQAKNPGRTDAANSDVYGADRPQQRVNVQGRWPANVVLVHAEQCTEGEPCEDGCPVAEMDRQSGITTNAAVTKRGGGRDARSDYRLRDQDNVPAYGDTGGASRYFPTFKYQAKTPASERPKIDGKGWPTVKPQGLMRWLVRLVTPPGGLVLDPFAGTSATLQAARDEGFPALGIERDEFAYRLSCVRLGLDDPGEGFSAALEVVELVPAPEPADPILVAIEGAQSMDEVNALYDANEAAWRDEHTEAVKARIPELTQAA